VRPCLKIKQQKVIFHSSLSFEDYPCKHVDTMLPPASWWPMVSLALNLSMLLATITNNASMNIYLHTCSPGI
jgi:hypothetical protein